MEETARFPVALESFEQLIDRAGFPHHQTEPENDRVTMNIMGEQTMLRTHVVVGKTPDGVARFTRFMTYSLDFEPGKLGVDYSQVLEWLNEKNADLLFGRYYYHKDSDTVVFELSMPCTSGIVEEDFHYMLGMATLSVDKAHEGLKALAPGGAEPVKAITP